MIMAIRSSVRTNVRTNVRNVIALASGGFLPTALANLYFWSKVETLARTIWNVATFQANNEANALLSGKLFTGGNMNMISNCYLQLPETIVLTDFDIRWLNTYTSGNTAVCGADDIANGIIVFPTGGNVLRFYINGQTYNFTCSTSGWKHRRLYRTGSELTFEENGVVVETKTGVDTSDFWIKYIGKYFTVTGAKLMKDFIVLSSESAKDSYNNPSDIIQLFADDPDCELLLPLNQQRLIKDKLAFDHSSNARHPKILSGSAASTNHASSTEVEFGLQTALTGYNMYGTVTVTGTISSSGTTVTGSSTDFVNELQVGDLIVADDELRRIDAIASATSLTVNEAWSVDLSADAFEVYSLNSEINRRKVNAKSSTHDIFLNPLLFPKRSNLFNLIDDGQHLGVSLGAVNDAVDGSAITIFFVFEANKLDANQIIFGNKDTGDGVSLFITSGNIIRLVNETGGVELFVDGTTSIEKFKTYYGAATITEAGVGAIYLGDDDNVVEEIATPTSVGTLGNGSLVPNIGRVSGNRFGGYINVLPSGSVETLATLNDLRTYFKNNTSAVG